MKDDVDVEDKTDVAENLKVPSLESDNGNDHNLKSAPDLQPQQTACYECDSCLQNKVSATTGPETPSQTTYESILYDISVGGLVLAICSSRHIGLAVGSYQVLEGPIAPAPWVCDPYFMPILSFRGRWWSLFIQILRYLITDGSGLLIFWFGGIDKTEVLSV